MTRREAREEAFFIIFEHSFSGEQVDDIIANAVEGRSLQINPFAYSLAKNTIEKIEELDQLIEKHATRWEKKPNLQSFIGCTAPCTVRNEV